MISPFRAALLTLATISLVSACHKKKPAVEPEPKPSTSDADARERARQDSIRRAEQARQDSIDRANAKAKPPATPTSTGRSVEELRRILQQPIYFDLDKSDLTDSARKLLDAKVEILQGRAEIRLRVNGHTDDRGSDEYNLALGMRRSATTKRYLVDHGIQEARFEIQSFGAEQPVTPEQTETAWAKNRRCEFEVLGLKGP